MFKILLLLISIIILLVLVGLDLGFFNEESIKKNSNNIVEIEKKKSKEEIKEEKRKISGSKEESFQTSTIEKIEKKVDKVDKVDKAIEKNEIKTLKLYAKVQLQKANNAERDEAIDIYNELIDKLSQSSDIQLLKIYALAQFSKSYLTSGEESLEIYNQIIEKLKDREEKGLLKVLYKAQITKAFLLENYLEQKNESIEVYDEIIKKFSSYEGKEYRDIVDNALFSKSFLLMGERDEDAIEIYDNIINNHERLLQSSATNLPIPLKVEYAIINNIELSLITNNDDSKYRELSDKYLSDNKDTKTQLDMLAILRDAQVSNQDEAMRAWQEKNKDYQFTDWSFAEIQQWNNQMEEGESKTRIKRYLSEFIKHNSENRNSYEHTR